MLKQELKNRNLPALLPREDMIEIMQREVYGYLPKNDFEWSVSNEKIIERRFAKGTVFHSSVDFTLTNKNGSHTFPVHKILHQDGKKHPVILCINIDKRVPDKYFPIEELAEQEFDIITYCYADITSDNDDFTTGIAPLVFPNGRQNDTDCGKIGLWAFANMRVLDYVLTLDGTDNKNIAILGHSRLGKTALVTGMLDERFTHVFSNNAGCAGDAIARGGTGIQFDDEGNFLIEKEFRGENIEVITRVFPYWFCANYKNYAEQGYGTDFDQHFLLGSIAPRNVCVNAAELDYWADQKSEQLCCMAAAKAWEDMGLDGIQECDHYLTSGERLLDGNVGFFMAPTMHFLSRHAWNNYMEFMRKHLNK
ncbi:MAG: hypothetical protein IKJ93_04825 [Clostridia bacterium]|nr:hypothetical protein [Clostridia bacterium]